MITTNEISWASGFLEGEGSFLNHGSPCVTAAQVQREPLDRLVRMFGGSLRQRSTNGFSDKLIWVWKLRKKKSVQVMMTLYVLMSPKRQTEIKNSLERWRRSISKGEAGSLICIKGHSVTGANAVVSRGRTYPACRECKNTARRAARKNAPPKRGARLATDP